MNLYVWNDVLCDYTCGIAVAMAETESEAREILINKADDWAKKTIAGDISKPADEIYDKPAGAFCWGGG